MVRQAERDHGRRPGLTTDERTRFKQFERENVELRRANEVLWLASAYFAKAELCPRVGFVVTTLTRTNRAVVRCYDERGTAEQWIKEGREATYWPQLSCHPGQ